MHYLPPIGQQPAPQPRAMPPSVRPAAIDRSAPILNLAAADNYYGKKAYDYDLGREDSDKWKAEYKAVQEGLSGITGTILDVPCGTGRFFPIYLERGFKILGMDISEDMLHQAKARDPQAQLQEGDIAKGIPLPDKSVDVTVCSQFLKFCTEPELAPIIREIARVTKSRILASLFTSDQPTFRGGNRNNVHNLAAFNKAIEDAGFAIKASAPIEPRKGHHIWMLDAA